MQYSFKILCAWILLLFLSLAFYLGCSVTQPSEQILKKGTFSAVSYNVHGLPPNITGDETYVRLKQIGPLLRPFDIVGLQEVFDEEGYDLLVKPKSHPHRYWFSKARPDRAVGSGLLFMTRFGVSERKTLTYERCHGYTDSASDCLASKGLQMTRLKLGDGVELDVYNSHFEAGSGDKDQDVRKSQVEEVMKAMKLWSKDRALIFLGDTNIRALKRKVDKQVLTKWMKELGLIDGCDAVKCKEKDRIDKVLFRSGGGLILAPTSWSIAKGFVDSKKVNLSDHEPILVRFTWSFKGKKTN